MPGGLFQKVVDAVKPKKTKARRAARESHLSEHTKLRLDRHERTRMAEMEFLSEHDRILSDNERENYEKMWKRDGSTYEWNFPQRIAFIKAIHKQHYPEFPVPEPDYAKYNRLERGQSSRNPNAVHPAPDEADEPASPTSPAGSLTSSPSVGILRHFSAYNTRTNSLNRSMSDTNVLPELIGDYMKTRVSKWGVENHPLVPLVPDIPQQVKHNIKNYKKTEFQRHKFELERLYNKHLNE